MVLVVSLAPRTSKACLRIVNRTSRPAEGHEEGKKFVLIDHKGLGLEHLPRHFVKWHGVCHPPPNGSPHDHPQPEKANDTKTGCLSRLYSGPGENPNPKDEYMLVRLPPYYKVRWNLECDKDPEIEETKYNNKSTWMEKIMVRFN